MWGVWGARKADDFAYWSCSGWSGSLQEKELAKVEEPLASKDSLLSLPQARVRGVQRWLDLVSQKM